MPKTTGALVQAVVILTLALGATLAIAAEDPSPASWASHMGKLPFTVGLKAGMKEVAFTGKAPMLFFTSKKDKWCPMFAKRTFSDQEVLKLIEDYTPILIDVDAEENKALKEEHMVMLVPGVVWLDFDGESVFSALGDAPLEIFSSMAEIAKARAPERHKPGEGHEELAKLAEALKEAVKGEKVTKILAAVAAAQEFGVGAAVQLEASRIDAKLTKQGMERITEAKALIEKRRKSRAKSILRKVVKEYGEHPVGKIATDLLASI